jgi:hypothetical protein
VTSIVVVAKVVVVVSIVIVIGGFSKVVGLCWFLTLLFEGCVRATDCRCWKLFFVAACDVG